MNLTDIIKVLEQGKEFSEHIEIDGEVLGEVIIRRPKKKWLKYVFAGAAAIAGIVSNLPSCEKRSYEDPRQYYAQRTDQSVEFVVSRTVESPMQVYQCSKLYASQVDALILTAQENDAKRGKLAGTFGLRETFYASEIGEILSYVSQKYSIVGAKLDKALRVVENGGGLTELRGEFNVR